MPWINVACYRLRVNKKSAFFSLFTRNSKRATRNATDLILQYADTPTSEDDRLLDRMGLEIFQAV